MAATDGGRVSPRSSRGCWWHYRLFSRLRGWLDSCGLAIQASLSLLKILHVDS